MYLKLKFQTSSDTDWGGYSTYDKGTVIAPLKLGVVEGDRRFFITEIGSDFVKFRRSDGENSSYGTFGTDNPLDAKSKIAYGDEERLDLHGSGASVSSSWSYNESTHGESTTLYLDDAPIIEEGWDTLVIHDGLRTLRFKRTDIEVDKQLPGFPTVHVKPSIIYPDGLTFYYFGHVGVGKPLEWKVNNGNHKDYPMSAYIEGSLVKITATDSANRIFEFTVDGLLWKKRNDSPEAMKALRKELLRQNRKADEAIDTFIGNVKS